MEINMHEVRDMSMGKERRHLTYLLVTNIVKEHAMWFKKKEWKRSVELDKVCIALIQDVVNHTEDIQITVVPLDACIKHFLDTVSKKGRGFSLKDISFLTKLESHINSLKSFYTAQYFFCICLHCGKIFEFFDLTKTKCVGNSFHTCICVFWHIEQVKTSSIFG